MKELQKISVLPSTKAEIKVFVENAKVEILSGNYNPIDIEVQLKALEELIKAIRKDPEVREYVLQEASRNEKTFETSKAKITTRTTARYDYSVDDTWSDLKGQEDVLANARKSRESFLKTIQVETADPTTGEMLQPIPSTGTETLSITLK